MWLNNDKGFRSDNDNDKQFSASTEVSRSPGVRRSGRHRVGVQKFWRGDNIQYGVDEEGLLVAEGIVKGKALPEASSPPSRCGAALVPVYTASLYEIRSVCMHAYMHICIYVSCCTSRSCV